MRPAICPSSTSKETPSRATMPPKRTETLRTLSRQRALPAPAGVARHRVCATIDGRVAPCSFYWGALPGHPHVGLSDRHAAPYWRLFAPGSRAPFGLWRTKSRDPQKGGKALAPHPITAQRSRISKALASAAQTPPGLLVQLAGDLEPLIALEPARGPAGLFLAIAVDVVATQVACPVQHTLDLPTVANRGFRLLHGCAGVGADRAALVQFAERADGGGFAFLLFAPGPVP